jgi:toxin CptA
MPSDATLSIPLRPSRRLAAALAVAHLVAAAAVLLAALPGWLAALLLLAVGASLARSRLAGVVAVLRLGRDGGFETVGADGTAMAAEVDAQTLVLGWLVVLVYRVEGRRRALVLPGDALDAEDARRLRVWLRWRAAAAEGA